MLALLYCVGGLAALTAASIPLDTRAPIDLARLLGVVDIGLGAVLGTTRHRLGAPALHAAVAIRIALVSVLAAYSITATAVALAGLSYVFLAIFTAYTFARRPARVHAVLAVAGFSGALVAGGIDHLLLVWLVVAVCVLAAGEVIGLIIAQLRRLACTDPLTGVANRTGFRLAAERQIATAMRDRTTLCLVLLDLDDFKAVNDTHGHLAGDRLLIEVAAAWKSELRGSDLLARYGGDEFALLLPATTTEGAACVLDRLRVPYPVSWSVGIACWAPGAGLDELLEQADQELYRAKEQRDRPESLPATASPPARASGTLSPAAT